MKKVYFLLLGLFLFSGVNGQNIVFQDQTFRTKLASTICTKDLNGNWFNVDSNGDYQIQISEALQVSELYLDGCNFSSLVGIANFTNINRITVINNGNIINSLDLTELVNLTYLNCENSHIASLNLSGLNKLSTIICKNNQITSLILNGCTSLTFLNCYSNSPLNVLDLNGLTNLVHLEAGGNDLTSLNLDGLINLNFLSCGNSEIASLDVSGLVNLNSLYLNSIDELTTLDVSNLVNLNNLDTSWCIGLNSLFLKNGKNESLYLFKCYNLQYICADEGQINQIQGVMTGYGYTDCSINSYCTFVPGGSHYSIQGSNTYDYDNNSCDALDIIYPNLKFSITDGTNNGSIVSNNSGSFNISVETGTYILTPVFDNPTYFNVSPASVTAEFPTQANPLIQNFCITANGIYPDLEITLLPLTPARPGFSPIYKIIYKNKGTTTQSGSVNLTFNDSVLDLVSSNPLVTSQTTNNLSWDYTNLLPFESREITLTLNVNTPTDSPAVSSGDILDFTATISTQATDETPNDNIFAFHQTVVNSHDPNDKTCLEGTTITPAMVGEYVHYVIRFENTGTYPAQNIVVKDMIDLSKFDINSLVPIKGSHEFVTNITAGNKVEFIFENINLPFDDANNDGFVAFKIKTKSSLVVGDTFTNSANIYFDYNFPIVTAPATTTVQTLGISDFEFAKYFTVYPNPVSNTLNLSTKSGISINAISIYNTLGQLVIAIPNAQTVSNIDVSSLKTGSYFIKINADKGTSNTKFIKQ